MKRKFRKNISDQNFLKMNENIKEVSRAEVTGEPKFDLEYLKKRPSKSILYVNCITCRRVAQVIDAKEEYLRCAFCDYDFFGRFSTMPLITLDFPSESNSKKDQPSGSGAQGRDAPSSNTNSDRQLRSLVLSFTQKNLEALGS